MAACGVLAILYWIVTMWNRPGFAKLQAEPPQGYSAGALGNLLTLGGMDMTMMVLSWAQLGYILIHIKGNRVIFPARDEGILLSRFRPDPREPVLALTTRDELISSAYAVSGARALRQSTRLGVAIHLLGGILGLIIMLVLGYLGSTELLTPTNVLLYQLIWAIPGLLVTEWTRVI